MKQHELKIWPEFLNKIISGEKTFEIRKDDRGFRAGDVLILQEWNPRTKRYTGRERYFNVPYVMSGLGLKKDWVAMSIKPRLIL